MFGLLLRVYKVNAEKDCSYIGERTIIGYEEMGDDSTIE